MSDVQELYVEEKIIIAMKEILSGRVNELLGEVLNHIPLVEFSDYEGADVAVPLITLSECERSEKERIIKLDAYTMTVTFSVPDSGDSELYCYAYSAALTKALNEDITLGGVVDRAIISNKKYVKPMVANCGENWQAIITLRLTIEGMNNVR
jgi:hypothetical protein